MSDPRLIRQMVNHMDTEDENKMNTLTSDIKAGLERAAATLPEGGNRKRPFVDNDQALLTIGTAAKRRAEIHHAKFTEFRDRVNAEWQKTDEDTKEELDDDTV